MTATQREGLSDAALALTQPVIDELLKDIARRIKDAGTITDTAEYQIYRAQALGESKQAIKAAVARQIKAQDKVIDSLFDYILDNSTPLTANGSLKQIAEGYAKMSRQKTAEQLKNLWADTPQGKAFLAENFKYFGYGYLNAPTDTIPNVPLVFYTFRIMVALGCYFILLFAVVLALVYRDTIDKRRWLLLALVWSIPLAYIASVSGWIVAEVGRQPWTIQDLLPTVASVSRINASSVMVTFFIFVALFTTLLIAELMIVTKQIKIGPKDETAPADKPNK